MVINIVTTDDYCLKVKNGDGVDLNFQTVRKKMVNRHISSPSFFQHEGEIRKDEVLTIELETHWLF